MPDEPALVPSGREPAQKPNEMPVAPPSAPTGVPPAPVNQPLPPVISPPPRPKAKIVGSILALLILVVSIPAGIILVRQTQEVRERAAGLDRAVLLGRVINDDPTYASCPERSFFYGDNCGNDQCRGAPNYTITWSQAGNSNSTGNSECYAHAGVDQPRYTFEHGDNPLGDSDGEDITVSISLEGNAPLGRWFFRNSNSAGQTKPGSEQSGNFASPGPNQTVTLKVYREGDYQWNHLWFVASSVTAQCLNVKAYDNKWQQLSADDLSKLKPGNTVVFATSGTTSSGTIDKARFRINGGPWQETTKRNPVALGEFYIDYTIPEAAQTFKVEAEVYHSTLGWR